MIETETNNEHGRLLSRLAESDASRRRDAYLGRRPPSGSVSVPPSKSYTHRAVLMASLAAADKGGRGSRIRNPLLSRDTNATVDACAAMGARMERSDGGVLTIRGTHPKVPDDVVDVENSGTTLRFMTSAFSLAPEGHVVLTGDASIRRRPMQPLLDTLGQLGVRAWSTRGNGCAPVIVRSGGMKGGQASIRGDVSSQFISSLIISSPMAEKDTTLKVADAVSRPYIEMTLRLAQRFGVKVLNRRILRVRGGVRAGVPRRRFLRPGGLQLGVLHSRGGRDDGRARQDREPGREPPTGGRAHHRDSQAHGSEGSRGEGALVVASDGDMLRGGTFDLGTPRPPPCRRRAGPEV